MRLVYIFAIIFAITFIIVKASATQIKTNPDAWGGGYGGDLTTVQHDGHKFVVATSVDGISVIHHPGCSCTK